VWVFTILVVVEEAVVRTASPVEEKQKKRRISVRKFTWNTCKQS